MKDDMALVKVPPVTLGFWIIKILATTLGETGGDSVSMSGRWEASPNVGRETLNGYLVGTAILGALLFGYLGAAALFAGLLAVLAALYLWTRISRVALFWAAFILTRPLGATVGDFPDKLLDKGGLDLSRAVATGVSTAGRVWLIALLPQRAGLHSAEPTR